MLAFSAGFSHSLGQERTCESSPRLSGSEGYSSTLALVTGAQQ